MTFCIAVRNGNGPYEMVIRTVLHWKFCSTRGKTLILYYDPLLEYLLKQLYLFIAIFKFLTLCLPSYGLKNFIPTLF